MFTGLSLDQAPPFEAPLKFFLVAIVFAVFSSILLLLAPDYNTHSPYMIATLHLFTIGFLINIIFGALQQMLPVVAGAVIPKPTLIANVTYITILIGIGSFVLGFLFYEKNLFFIGATFLLISISFFITITLYQLSKVANKSTIVLGMIISLIFLLFSMLIGIHLLISHATANISQYHLLFTNIHYNFIFFGFIFILISSITFQVVPMFWVADNFKQYEQKIILYASTLLLVVYPIVLLLFQNLFFVYKLLFSIVVLYFSLLTLKKLKNRKRKLLDMSVMFYYQSMIFLFISVCYWIFLSYFDMPITPLFILFGVGFAYSLMNGMLYKIIPFLSWFHLSSKGIFDIPSMRDMIPINNIKIQFSLHLLSVMLFLFGFWFNIIITIKIASFIFIISNFLLLINLLKAVKIYIRKNNERKNDTVSTDFTQTNFKERI